MPPAHQQTRTARRLGILFLRCALYAAPLAFLLWYLYGFTKLIEVGQLSRGESIGEVGTMTSVMVFIALLGWLFTWKHQENYGAGIATLIFGFLNGAHLVLFMFFVLGAIPALAWHSRVFFLQGDLALFFVVIPYGAITAVIAEVLTIPLLPKREINLVQAAWDDRPTLKP